jgi:nucleotide-binding universal stress UspA family protein
MNAIRKILVPTGFSAESHEAFRVALTRAEACGAEVTLFHVAHAPAVVTEGGKLLSRPDTGEAVNLREHFQRI